MNRDSLFLWYSMSAVYYYSRDTFQTFLWEWKITLNPVKERRQASRPLLSFLGKPQINTCVRKQAILLIFVFFLLGSFARHGFTFIFIPTFCILNRKLFLEFCFLQNEKEFEKNTLGEGGRKRGGGWRAGMARGRGRGKRKTREERGRERNGNNQTYRYWLVILHSTNSPLIDVVLNARLVQFKHETEAHNQVTRRQEILFAPYHKAASREVLSSGGRFGHLRMMYPPRRGHNAGLPGGAVRHSHAPCFVEGLRRDRLAAGVFYYDASSAMEVGVNIEIT